MIWIALPEKYNTHYFLLKKIYPLYIKKLGCISDHFLFTALMFLVFFFNPRKYKRVWIPLPQGFSEFFPRG